VKRAIPFMVLVCLLLPVASHPATSKQKSDHINIIVQPSNPSPFYVNALGSGERPLLMGMSGMPEAGLSWKQASAEPWDETAEHRRRGAPRPSARPIVKCKAPLVQPCAPACAVPFCPDCILPCRFMGQWELEAQLFYARTSGTVQWPAVAFFGTIPTTELDPVHDLGIPGHAYLGEYTARYQFRPNWALHYSVMPFELSGTNLLDRSIVLGNWILPFGSTINTKWQFLYQRLGLIYQPIVTQYAIVSIFNYWLYQSQQLSVSSQACINTACYRVDRTRNMIMSGIEVQKCIVTLPNAATLSCDTRVGLGYLDQTFSLDLQTGLQFSVPMNANRWGYAKGGYRWINFKEGRDDLHWDTALEGWFAEAGLIF